MTGQTSARRLSPAPSLAGLTLGTVQLGLDYGVMNSTGRPSTALALDLLDRAAALDLASLDTAHAYGEAERVVGAWLALPGRSCEIVTKLPPLEEPAAANAESRLKESLARLGRRRVDGLLLHRPGDLRLPGLSAWIAATRDSGRIGAFGLSVYNALEIDAEASLELLQIPANVFVQSVARSAPVERFRQRGGQVFVRSVFAQGLLLAEPDAIPATLAACRQHVVHFRQIAQDAEVTAAALAVAAVRALLPGSRLVVGADSRAQLDELAAAATASVPAAAIAAALALGRNVPEPMFDPRRWPQRASGR